jgi:flagellar hook-associated protein 1 FlgK
MSITAALYSSFHGLRNTESKIAVTSQNVTNADRAGYTRKEIESQYLTTNAGTVPIRSTVETVNYNEFILKNLLEDTTIAVSNNTIAQYLTSYANDLGSIDGDNSLSAYIDDMINALSRLSITPEDISLKNQFVADANRVAIELNRLSDSVQDARLKIDQDIDRAIGEVNESLKVIDRLNFEIIRAETLGTTTADLIDLRHVELENLSQLIDYDYFIDSKNKLQIYTAGMPLLDSRPREIEFESVTALDKNTIYPAGFNPIDLNGTDITPFLSGGEIGGLLELRDGIMVEEQAKLDEFASVLATELNAIHSEGASIPPRPDMIGDIEGLGLGDLLGGTGNIRIDVLDSDGIVQNQANLNLASFTTIGDLVTGINTALGPDVTASLTTDGQLSLIANNPGEGLALGQGTSDFGGDNFSTNFGLNNIFNGTGADVIQVSDYLLNNGSYLSTSRLNTGTGIGDRAVNVGDASLTNELSTAFSTSYSYAAAGNFAAQNDSLNNYIDKIISDVAFRANNAKTDADITSNLMQQTKNTLQNLSGVNIDEEMAYLIDLEAKYEASATMLSVLQEMYDTLIAAVR